MWPLRRAQYCTRLSDTTLGRGLSVQTLCLVMSIVSLPDPPTKAFGSVPHLCFIHIDTIDLPIRAYAGIGGCGPERAFLNPIGELILRLQDGHGWYLTRMPRVIVGPSLGCHRSRVTGGITSFRCARSSLGPDQNPLPGIHGAATRRE